MRHYIVGTSVLVAGLLTQRESSPTVRWLRILLEGAEPILGSPALVAEYRAVSLRKLGMPAADVDAVLAAVLLHARILDPPPARQPPPDPGDARLWALLDEDSISCLVTGDAALIESRKDGRALNPRDALARWLSAG
jgi:predicted nucleic acid-binding protein